MFLRWTDHWVLLRRAPEGWQTASNSRLIFHPNLSEPFVGVRPQCSAFLISCQLSLSDYLPQQLDPLLMKFFPVCCCHGEGIVARRVVCWHSFCCAMWDVNSPKKRRLALVGGLEGGWGKSNDDLWPLMHRKQMQTHKDATKLRAHTSTQI